MLFCRTVFHVSLHGSWPDNGLMLFSQKQKLRKDTAALPCGPASPLPHSKTTCCSKFTVSTSHWRRQCAHMEDLIQRKTKEMKNDSAICRDHEKGNKGIGCLDCLCQRIVWMSQVKTNERALQRQDPGDADIWYIKLKIICIIYASHPPNASNESHASHVTYDGPVMWISTWNLKWQAYE